MPKAKEIDFGHKARLRVKAGVDKAAEAVKPTLGPVGMTALIEVKGLDPILCDDGVTILKNLEFTDPYENMGLQMLRKGSVRTSTEGGDGTATTAVTTQALVAEAFKEVANDSSKIREVRERLGAGLEQVMVELTKLKRDVTEDDIERIAAISSLDPEVATLIADIIKQVGVNGAVTVQKGSKQGYSKEVVMGAQFNKGLISPFFINNHETKQTILDDVYVVLVDRKISTNEQILSLLNSIGTGQDILIIADTVESVALATLAQNAMNKVADIACVANPYSGSRAREFLADMAALTGATVISEERGMRLDQMTKDVCGRAERVEVSKDTTTIIGGKGDASTQIASIENDIASTTSTYERQMLEDRLAQLTGGIGVVRVGAYTDTEYNAKKYKFENAINATKAALQEGILPGGGSALYTVSRADIDPVFKRALTAPFNQMATNAGIWENLRILTNTDPEMGYDFKRKEWVNLFDAGIIDPFKVTRLALESAVSVAQGLIGVETAIVEVQDETDPR